MCLFEEGWHIRPVVIFLSPLDQEDLFVRLAA
jgi:hypothetical protein